MRALLLAGSINLREFDGFHGFASELGVLFQIVDDILDVTGSEETLGKHQGSDERLGKRTYVTEFGLEGARRAGRGVAPTGARGALDAAGPAGAAASSSRSPTSSRPAPSDDRDCSIESTSPRTCTASATSELQEVAQEVREHIIDTVGEIGGHFGANLGTCEIAVALHSLLDSPRDKILWDVGHQAYPHKILTGRRDQLQTIRKYQGLAPFCAIARVRARHHGRRARLDRDRLRRRDQGGDAAGDGEDGHVVAVVGDGAMTGGVAFEAVHQAGGEGTPIVVVLNDNGMSIAPNVGALSRYFNRVRLNPKLWHAREGVEERADQAARPGSAPRSSGSGPHVKESIKAFWAPGPVVGGARLRLHGRDRRPRRPRAAARPARGARPPSGPWSSTARRSRARASRRPRTAAWRAWRSGTRPSPSRSPTARPRRRSASRPARKPSPPQYTQVFGDALVDECRRDERVIGITAAMNSGTGLNILQRELPDRYFDVGIAEQQAVLFAAGLALQGCKPVAAIYSTFLQRAYDQIVHDVCLQKLNVVFAMDRAGLVGDDGPTHHGAFDIAYLRCLPNIVLMAPRDEAMLVHMLRTALTYDDGPVALRYPRGEARRRAAARRARGDRDRHRRDPARGRARRAARLRQPASARRSTRPTSWPSTASR